MAEQFNDPFPPFFDDAGEILSDGFIGFFASGTMVEKNTYPTAAGADATDENDNPVPLGADGRTEVPVFTEDGSYKIILYDSGMVQLQEFDPYITPNSQLQTFQPGFTYNKNDRVRFDDDDLLYVSLKDNNTTVPVVGADWSKYLLLREWNTLENYPIGAAVTYTDNFIYTANTVNNGKIPPDNPTEWNSITGSLLASGLLQYVAADTGEKVVTGLAFQPVSIKLSAIASDTANNYIATCFGYANSNSDQGSIGAAVDDDPDVLSFNDTSNFLTVKNADGLGPYQLHLDSFDSNGFTFSFVGSIPALGTLNIIWSVEG